MPKKNEVEVIKLTDEEKKQMEALKSDIEKGKKAVAALKEMDVDVTTLEERIEWAEKARDVLLKEFV